MSRKSKKCKQRALDMGSNPDTVISNLAANEDNSTQMDRLKTLQEMFADRIDADIVHDVFQECAGNAEQTLESLLELCETAQYLPNEPSSGVASNTIEEVPHSVTELPPTLSTNSNTEYRCRSTADPNVEVLNKLPVNSQVGQISALNAVMPFASLFAPKNAQPFVNHKPSQPSKAKIVDKFIEIKTMIRSGTQKILILMRGLPGSGKTYLANELVRGTQGLILSTDDYFIQNGRYMYDPSRLPFAHDWNQQRAKKWMERGRTPIIIDNTNLEAWEMKPYVSYGYVNGFTIMFVEPDNKWSKNLKDLSKRNIHGIPKDKLEIMAQRFEKITVEQMVRSLNLNGHHPIYPLPMPRSDSDDKVPDHKKISTNGLKQMVFRSKSSPSTGLAITAKSKDNGDYAESSQSSQTSLSAQSIDIASNNSQKESSSSPTSTSPATDNHIDMDLLLALHRKSTDDETSSLSASDTSSVKSQESGWERDEEFTYAHNSVNECNDDHKPSGSGNGVTKIDDKLSDELPPNPQRDKKPKNAIKVEESIKEENSNDIEFEEPWEEITELSDKAEANPSIGQQETNGKLKKFGLIGVRKPNWEFPAFPVDNLKNYDAANDQISITCYARQTQTEPKDWALLQLRQCNKDSNEGLETESSDGEEIPIETTVDPTRYKLVVSLHKGTFTSDIPDDLTRDQKLNTLRQKFPKAEDNHLNEILDACLEDYNWAEKVLSELNDDQFDVSALEHLTASADPSVGSPDLDSESTSTEDEPSEPLVDRRNSDQPEFVLTIDHLLAAQLQSQFGVVTDSLSAEDLTIKLSHGVARLLHHNWKKSLNQKPLQSNSNSSQTQSINIYNNFNGNKNKISSNHKSKKSLDLERNTPKSELQEIMDLELAKELSRQEYDQSLKADALNTSLCPTQRLAARELLSTKLKRDQLYQRYPGVDQSFLDTIFESHGYQFGKTIDFLDNSLGLSDDFTESRETEHFFAEERFGSPVNGHSRSASPTKPVRKKVDVKATLADMNALLEKKQEYHNKTRLAFQRKMYAVASYYGDEATQLQRKIERLSNEIVDAILSNCSNSNELDLHGLHIREVNSILSEYLRRKSEELVRTPGKRRLCVDIITGYGATKGVQGTIKPTVIQYLRQKSLPFEMVNMGVIRVTLCQ